MEELNKSNDLIESLTHKKTTILRFPGGAYGYSEKLIEKIPYSIFNWTTDTKDWQANNTKDIIDKIRASKDGDILFLHDYPTITARALEESLPELINEGYEFMTLSELAKANGITLKLGTIYDGFKKNN